MVGSEKNGNPAGGCSSGGIPEILRILPASITKTVVFPHRLFTNLSYATNNKKMVSDLKLAAEDGHAFVLVSVNGKVTEIGVLCETKNFRFFPKNGVVSVDIKPLKRVYCTEIVFAPDPAAGFTRVKWNYRNEIAVSPERGEEKSFVDKMIALCFSFHEFESAIGGSLSESEGKYFENANRLLGELNAENLSETLDIIMAVLQNVYWTWEDFDFGTPAFIILKEENVETRLDRVVELLEIIFHHVMDYGLLGDDDVWRTGSLPERALVKYDAKKPAVDTSLAEVNIREELAKPRKTTKPPMIISAGVRHGSTTLLDHKKPDAFSKNVVEFLDQRVVGQERAKIHMARVFLRIKLGRTDPRRPLIGGIFCGPTGVGKTELVKAGAEFMFGDFNGYTHIGCNTLQEHHDVKCLDGAPPSYVGYNDDTILAQWRLDRPHFLWHMSQKHGVKIGDTKKVLSELSSKHPQFTEKQVMTASGYRPEDKYWSIVLLDEIERAHPALYSFLLRIFDDGTLALKNGEFTDLKRTVFFLTSNIHGKEILEEGSGKNIGFHQAGENLSVEKRFVSQTWKEVVGAVVKHFSSNPAFLGRIGKENLIVFYPLGAKELLQILENIYLPEFTEYMKEKAGIDKFFITDKAKNLVIAETRDPTSRVLGARALKKVFERMVEIPVLNLLARAEEGDGLKAGDRVLVDAKDGAMFIFKEAD